MRVDISEKCMKKRKSIKTTITEIVNYWQARVSDDMIGVEWENASECCWRCAQKRNLQRCHIIPDSLGGKDEPSNFVLLCESCHAEAPNVSDPEVMWDWLASYSFWSNMFWILQGFKEYEFIYGNTFEKELSDIMTRAPVQEITDEQIRKYTYDALKHTSIHFGQSRLNAATVAGAHRMMLKAIAMDYGVLFPIIEDPGTDS